MHIKGKERVNNKYQLKGLIHRTREGGEREGYM